VGSLDLWIGSVGFGAVMASILAVAAVGFTLQFGVTNILNISYGAVMIGSAFIGYAANRAGADIWVSALVATAFGAVSSEVLNRAVFAPFLRRVGRLGMLIVTLSAAISIRNLFLAGFGPHFFSYRFSPGRTYHLSAIALTEAQVIVMGVAVVCLVIVHGMLTHTKLGKAMRATAGNRDLARACGIPVDRVGDAVWLISGALCGLAGVILVLDTGAFQSTTADNFLLVVIAAAVLGGVGKPYGAMAGAVVLGLATQMSTVVVSPGYEDVVAFVTLIVVLIVRQSWALPATAATR
jgi:branched-subunit amino acid ABC-type transport system permease component